MNISTLLKGANLAPDVLENRSAYIKAVNLGVPGAIVKPAVANLKERDLFIRLLDTNSANLNRFYSRKTLSKAQSEGVLDTLRVFNTANSVFEDEEIATEWLHTKIPALSNQSPVDLCDTFEGRTMIKEALMAIEYGEFS